MNALITAHNSEITCLSENFLSSTVPHNDENNGSSLLRNDNQNSIKREWVCMYFTKSLLLIRWRDLSNMKECLITEINANNKKWFFTCLYTSPSQSHEELESFCFNLDLFLSNINDQHPAYWVVIGVLMRNVRNISLLTKITQQSLYQTALQQQQVIVKWLINEHTLLMNHNPVTI